LMNPRRVSFEISRDFVFITFFSPIKMKMSLRY